MLGIQGLKPQSSSVASSIDKDSFQRRLCNAEKDLSAMLSCKLFLGNWIRYIKLDKILQKMPSCFNKHGLIAGCQNRKLQDHISTTHRKQKLEV